MRIDVVRHHRAHLVALAVFDGSMDGPDMKSGTERKAAQLLEVRSISDQIKENNQVYKATVLKLAIVKATDNVLEEFEDTTIKSLYHSIILHHADDIPVQLEDRFVNPAIDKIQFLAKS